MTQKLACNLGRRGTSINGFCAGDGPHSSQRRQQVQIDIRTISDDPWFLFLAVGFLASLHGTIGIVQSLPGFGHKSMSGKCELNRLLGSSEELEPEKRFQLKDLFAQRGLRNMQPLRCMTEMQFLGDYHNVAQQPQLDTWVHDSLSSSARDCVFFDETHEPNVVVVCRASPVQRSHTQRPANDSAAFVPRV